MSRFAPFPALRFQPSAKSGGRRAFTLVELLTVIAIIGILAGVLIPTVQVVKLHANQSKSTANLHSIGGAFSSYSLDNKGLLPAPEFGPGGSGSMPGSQNPEGGSWLEELVPYTGGTMRPAPSGTVAEVVAWPPTLSDPQFAAMGLISPSNPDVRGYGMMIFPYRPDPSSINFAQPFTSQRQKLAQLPNPANNVIVTLSNAIIIEPDEKGEFKKSGDTYVDGDAARYSGIGLYLTVDGAVQELTPDEAAKLMAAPVK